MNENMSIDEQVAFLTGYEQGAKEVIKQISALPTDLTTMLMDTIFRERARINEQVTNGTDTDTKQTQ